MNAIVKKLDFTGRKVLLSGGLETLCPAIARKFVEHSAEVFVIDENKKALSILKEQIPEVRTLCIDQKNWLQLKIVVEQIGPIHHLVCDAPIFGKLKYFMDYEKEDFDGVYDANVTSLVALGQAMASGIANNRIEGGTIVNVSSISAASPVFGTLIYGSSKAAIESITRIMAKELAPLKIRVNCVRPGVCKVAKLAQVPEEAREEEISRVLSRQNLGKTPLDPEDVASAVVVLSSSLFPSMTGAIVPIDGGFGAS